MSFPFARFEGEFAHATELAFLRHELCQPLTYLFTSLDVVRVRLERELPPSSRGPTMRMLAAAREAAAHLHDVVHRIRALDTIEDIGSVDLADVVISTLLIIENDLSRHADLVRQVECRPMVKGSRTRLRQVVLNLLTNAALAVEERGVRGTITVRIAMLNDSHVALTIRDDGVGVSPANIGKLTDLHFTTRPGRGTGFGLSLCRGIVEAYGGTLRIDGEPTQGTTVHLSLPVAEDI